MSSLLEENSQISCDELQDMKAHYLTHGFCYVRGAVAEKDVDALVEDLWRQAEVKTSSHWNGKFH